MSRLPLRIVLLACVACARTGDAEQTAEKVVPFRTPSPVAPFIIFDAQLGDWPSAPVLLDTGDVAPFLVVVPPEAAQRTGLRRVDAPPQVSRAVVGLEPIVMHAAILPSFRAGPVSVAGASAAIVPAVTASVRVIGAPIAGIVGYELLRDRVVAIDYHCRRLDLAAAPPDRAPTAAIRIAPLRPLTLVETRVGGRGPFLFAVDTGARSTFVSPEAARWAGIRLRDPIEIHGAGGAEPGAVAARARIRAGNGAARDVDVVVSDVLARIGGEAGVRLDGILGTDIIARGRLTIDYPGRRLWIDDGPGRGCGR